jgi:hypothetical protein
MKMIFVVILAVLVTSILPLGSIGRAIGVVEDPIQPASYIIDTAGSFYTMTNGTTFQVDYLSDNATRVFAFAYGNLTSGGKIFVKNGIYNLTGSITPSNGTVTEGESWQTILAGETGCSTIFFLVGTSNGHYVDIQIKNLQLDGTGLSSGKGVYANYVDNLLVEHCYVHDTPHTGIGPDYLTNFTIKDNLVVNCAKTVDGNGIGIGGPSSNGSIYGNNVTGTTKVKMYGHGIVLEELLNPGLITDVVVSNNVALSNGDSGFLGKDITNCTIVDNDFSNNFANGIYVYDWNESFVGSHDVVIEANTCHYNSDAGIRIRGTTPSTRDFLITRNNVTYNAIGIITYVNETTINKNYVSYNARYGLYINNGAQANSITDNNVLANGNADIYLNSSSNNDIYHNEFIDNGAQVHSLDSVNVWDDGYPSGGNYWNDYDGNDTNRDGIGDTPYIIDSNNQDRYPLIRPWGQNSDIPVAIFTYSPIQPLGDEEIAFDASASYDLDGFITNYDWNFGDGTELSGPSDVSYHSYSKAGIYNVTLTVMDNSSLSALRTRRIVVDKIPSEIFLSANPTELRIGEQTMLSGSIYPSRPGSNVTVWFRLNGEPTWQALVDLETNETSQYEYNWTPPAGGIYSLKANWTGNDNATSSESSEITVTCEMIPTELSLSTTSSTVYVGFQVNITGRLNDVDNASLAGETVVLYYTFSGITTWTPITSAITDGVGEYSATWIPTATGYFVLKAEWAGNATHSYVNSTTTLSTISYSNQYVFTVESNSTISELAFNTTDWALSFSASGPDGTTGYVRVTAAKTLVVSPEKIRVHLDGKQAQFSMLSIGDSWLLTFEYQHSSHQVQVDFDIGRPDHTPPVADAGPDQSVDEDVQVQLNGSGSTDNIGITSYVWTFVDGTNKTLEGNAPAYTFSNPGIYTVMLNVTDAAGNWATDTVTLTIRDITPPTIGTVSQSPSSDVGIGQVVLVSASIVDAGSGVKNASLFYSYDNGSSWQPRLRMVYNSTSGLYETTILGHIYGTWIKYKITAYDNSGNSMTEDNAGQYYSYQVIPEFPATYVILLFILTTTLAVTNCRKNKAHAHNTQRTR